MHAGLGAQPAIGVIAAEVDGAALDAGDFAVADFLDLGLEAALIAPAQVHAHAAFCAQSCASVPPAPAWMSRKQLCGSISPREHALEFQLLQVRIDGRRQVALRHRRRRWARSRRCAISSSSLASLRPWVALSSVADDQLQACAFLTQLLGPVGRIPDRGVFQLAAYFREAFALGVVVKETS